MGVAMTEERTRRKLSGILSADAVGYSRLMEEDEAATIVTLAGSKELMANLIGQYRGRIVDAPGDNLLAEFGSVVDATECAVKIQQELKAKNEKLPANRRMDFRIGVNLGDVVEEVGRIYGDGVNIAARLEGLAAPGGICISRTAYDHVKNKLKLGYEYLGEHRVKNIAEPVRVYRVLVEPEAAGKVIGEKRFIGRISRKAAIAAIIALIIVAGGLIGWNIYLHQSKKVEAATPDKMAYPLPDKPSIAVLPFDNLSGDPAQEYFSDGITEEIITALSRVPKLFVIARNSTFTYKGKPVKIKQVSEDLGVRYVLEGSVRKVENQVRITAQLIDAIKGYHLWAERYDRDLKDIFAIQDEITMKIITALRVKLTEGEQAAFRIKSPANLDAYLKYLEAREYATDFNRDTNIKARKLAEETIALDPGFQGGYAVLSQVEFFDVWLRLSKSPKESMMRAIELAKKAIAMEDSPEPHRTLAGVYAFLRKYDEAIAEGKKAIELDPNSANAHGSLGHALMMSDMPQEAIPVLKRAIRLNPYPPSRYFHNLAASYNLLGKYEEGIAAASKGIQIEPNDIYSHLPLLYGYFMSGREQEARAQAAEVLRINPKFCIRSEPGSHKNPESTAHYRNVLRKAGIPDCPAP
jgi:adenylate cyclase